MTKRKDYAPMEREYPTQDWLAPDGAERLARQIREYWSRLGFRVETLTISAMGCHMVRSDMINGMPVACEAETERAA